MVSSLANFAQSTNDYAEIARRPLEAEHCALIVIDIQEKLLPPIFQKEQLIRNSQLLIRLAGCVKIPADCNHTTCQGTGARRARHRFPAAGIGGHRQANVLLLRQRYFLLLAEAFAQQSQHRAPLRNGEPHLRSTNCPCRLARRLSCARGFGRYQFADRVELEDWSRAYARGWRHNFID